MAVSIQFWSPKFVTPWKSFRNRSDTNLAPDLKPTWYQIYYQLGTNLVPTWHQMGTRLVIDLVPGWYQVGIRSGTRLVPGWYLS